MYSEYIENFHEVLEVINNSLTQCPAWSVIKDPLFIAIFIGLLCILMLRKTYKAVVALISGLVLVVICQTTLINVVVPDCFANKLPVFVVGLLTVAAVNVYFILIRD